MDLKENLIRTFLLTNQVSPYLHACVGQLTLMNPKTTIFLVLLFET